MKYLYKLLSIFKRDKSKRLFIDECNTHTKKQIEYYRGKPNVVIDEFKRFYASDDIDNRKN